MADTAALVVALSAQLTKFEKDMSDAVKISQKKTEEIESNFAKMNAELNRQLSYFASSAIARLGPIGQVLASIGPVGLTATAAIGVLAGAFVFLTEKVNAFAERSKALQEGAETAGLTVNQFKALTDAGAKVGLDFEQTEKFVTRLTLAISDLRTKGQGPLFDALLKINPQLITQIAGAKNVAAAIDILSTAYKGLTDQVQKNALVGAIAGKRNVAGGRLLESIPADGGLDALVESAKQAGKAVDDELIARVVKLRVEIDAIQKQTDNIWGRAFAPDVLNAEKQTAEFWQQIALSIERIKNNPTVAGILESLSRGAQKALDAGKPPLTFNERFAPAAALPAAANKADVDADNAAAARSRTLTTDLALMQRWTSVLGDALTQSEALKQKQLELAVAVDKGGVSQEQAARALNAFKLQQQQLAEATRERLGIANQQEIEQTKINQLSQDAAKFGLSENEVLQARNVILLEVKAAADALTVRQSYLPGLKQLELDSENVRKTLDTLATSTLNTLTDGFADVIVGTKTLADAFKSMTNSILTDLVRIALRQTIIAPLSGALGGLFPSAGGLSLPGRAGGGPVTSGQSYIVGENGPEMFVPQQSGSIVPNSISSGRGGGTTIEVNNFTAGDTDTKQTQSEGPDGQRVVIDIVKRAQARGEFDAVNRGRFALRPQKVR